MLLFLLFFGVAEGSAFGAVGCDLNDPVRDVARLFPGSTSYKTLYVSIGERGGEPLLRKIKERLGGNATTLFAPIDVPYTIYEIYNGQQKIGTIHGVNQKGEFGGIQVFVAQDLAGTIKTFYIQKISGQWAGKLRDPAFGSQFVGLSVKDFDTLDPVSGKGTGRVAKIRSPVPETETDFVCVLRGLKKNLILMDEFVFSAERSK